jgi:hypothetical protein
MNTDRYYDVENSDWIHVDDHNRELDYLESRLQELEQIEDYYLSEERCVLEQLFDVVDMLKENRPNQFVIEKLDSIINLHSKDLVNEIKIQRLDNA